MKTWLFKNNTLLCVRVSLQFGVCIDVALFDTWRGIIIYLPIVTISYQWHNA